MTITCPEPAALKAPAEDPQLDAEMAAAAQCATLLEHAGLRVAFDDHADRPLAIAIERPAGERLRRLDGRDLLALIALSPAQLRRWAERPELPIPGSPAR